MDSTFECPNEYKEWPKLGVPSQIVKGLVELGFVSPTEIQQRVIPAALKGDADVVGAAETVRNYRIAGNIDEELILAVCCKIANIKIRHYYFVGVVPQARAM